MTERTRTIYLIRHALPDFGSEGRRCIGRTDLPLSEMGRVQASAVGRWLQTKGLTAVYSSPMRRAMQTALFLGPMAIRVPGLEEMNMGEWEGKNFDEIKRSYPEAYAERGRDIAHSAPPGGESFVQCGLRAWAAFRGVLEQSTGNIAIVAHCSVNRSLLCQIQGRDLSEVLTIEQPISSVNTLLENDRKLTVLSIGEVVSETLIHSIKKEKQNGDS